MTMATMGLSMLGGLGGSIMQGIGGANSAEAGAQASYYKSAIAMQNMQMALQAADRAEKKGAIDSMNYGIAGAQKAGTMIAAQGASGVDVGSATFKETRGNQAEMTALGEHNIMDEAMLKSYGYKVQATGDLNSAIMAQRAGQNLQDSEGMILGSSILGGASQFASKWSQSKSMGIF